jgi:AcrR family transcriptional regulator
MADTAGRRSGYHHGDLRNALESAALELVSERGTQGFSLAEASRRAGVSVAAPFKHFANREALLAALALKGYQEQRRRFAAAIGRATDPAEQLAEFAVAYVRFTVEEAALFQVTFGAGIDKTGHPELEEAGRQVLDLLTRPATALRRDPAGAVALVHGVGAVAHGYAAFLAEGVFGTGPGALQDAEDGARAAAGLLARASTPVTSG